MSHLQIKHCEGFTKDEAFQDLDFIPNLVSLPGTNCTHAWKKAGSPNVYTKEFRLFVIEQLAEKTKNVPGLGLHIVLEPPQINSRKRPYKIINNVVDSTRKWDFIKYEIIEVKLINEEFATYDVDDEGNRIENGTFIEPTISEYGQYIETVDSKAEAFKRIKELTSVNKKDYIARAIKVPDRAPVAIYSKYTPSEGTKIGKFVAFGYSKHDLD